MDSKTWRTWSIVTIVIGIAMLVAIEGVVSVLGLAFVLGGIVALIYGKARTRAA